METYEVLTGIGTVCGLVLMIFGISNEVELTGFLLMVMSIFYLDIRKHQGCSFKEKG